ncbi:hypothetical protein [Bacillus pumilus]|jgi:hypothetical protein|uniref:hypothetical protein n=1 Tax=Bacillus pumilus TaxID=1408 RepID=UPI00081FEF4F|nr:hypothetical protein [Bacillus pumilus]AOC58685.1 hypothetical protein BEN31_18735 [Bacillus pumilus]MBR0588660.1 hypothetical protein [Bacillus pumilus DW2J2]MBR0618628.1 hypothetical protein [Bacillus pumilus]MBR0624697.1 hypothetical protein [Bacillus pumilus]MCY7724054.1 hypothetical protein [Bacillus pumilus]
MAQYKTEKRKANVGERILITDDKNREYLYKNGDVFTVTEAKSQGVLVGILNGISHRRYEVIVGEHTPAPNLDEMDYDELVALSESVMKALRTRSFKNGYDQGRLDTEIEAAHGTYEKSDQQKRDEIVEKAKEDVRELLVKDRGHDHEFIVNESKRTVVDLRKIRGCTNIARRGIAKCAPNDCFNVHIGKAIALRRALGLEVPAEYLNAPQPTEVRVGDVVRGRQANGVEFYEETIKNIKDGAYYYDDGFDFISNAELVIIDDSRTEGGA